MQEEGRRKGNGRVYLPLSQPGKDWLKIFNEYLKYCNVNDIPLWLPLRVMINKILISVNWRMKTMKP